MQTLWDLMDDLEVKDLKATNGKITRFALQEMSFKRLLKEGVKEVFGSGATSKDTACKPRSSPGSSNGA